MTDDWAGVFTRASRGLMAAHTKSSVELRPWIYSVTMREIASLVA